MSTFDGERRDFEDAILEGTIRVPHESFDRLIAMVREEMRQGAPDFSWAIDGVAEGQELPANVEDALRAYFDAPTMKDVVSELRARVVEFGPSGEDMEDDLRERAENIRAARDAAFERGQDCWDADPEPGFDRDSLAAKYYAHPKLVADFMAGWDAAALDEAEYRSRVTP